MRTGTLRMLALTALACTTVGCSRRDESSAGAQTATPPQPVVVRPSARVEASEQVLREYLGYLVMPLPRAVPDSITTCERYGEQATQLALATYRILGSTLQADTAVVRAEIVSAATVTLGPGDVAEVRERARTDTLSWSLLRPAGSQRWRVCGHSREGPDLVRLQYLGPPTRWLGGTSLTRIQRLADSLARAQK